MNDRELLMHWQEEQHLETQAVDHVQHYTALGVGMAAFAMAMMHALTGEDVTHEEALALVKAALTGR